MKPFVQSRVALVLLGLATLTGCNQSGEPTVTISTPALRTPQELIETIEECINSAQTTFETLESNRRSFRVEMLRKQITEGRAAIDELVAHSDSTPQQADAARSAESSLLYFGAVRLQPDYVQELSSCAERLLSDHVDSAACRLALGRWLDFRYASQDAPFDEALVTIADYARLYPQEAETIALFSKLSNRLVQEKKFKPAQQALEVGDSILADPNALKTAKQYAAKCLRIEKQRMARKEAERRYRAHVKSIVGGRERGYFVVYSEEPSTRLCDYSKCHGLKEVVAYAKDADKKKWKWEFIMSYPDTREGSIDATNKVTILYRQNTTISFGS
jgi:hypothetical protein